MRRSTKNMAFKMQVLYRMAKMKPEQKMAYLKYGQEPIIVEKDDNNKLLKTSQREGEE